MSRLLLIGLPESFQLGTMLHTAAKSIGLQAEFSDAALAYQGKWLMQRINWQLRGHHPIRLNSFSENVVRLCQNYRPDILLVTGMLPPSAKALNSIHQMGITCINFLTDDPWNPTHKAPWFMQAMPHYDVIFSPRRANLNELANIGCRALYLPFAYDPAQHFPEPYPRESAKKFECDVLFYGGADADRIPYITSLINAGYKLHLYGGYWKRYTQTRPIHKGMADVQTLRWAISGAKVTMCLVRRANRDGHVMRSFEAAAMGGCLLVEDTEEHRAIFGNDGESVVYFHTMQEMNEKVAMLLADPLLRQHLIDNVRNKVAHSKNWYADRLSTMITIAKGNF